MTDGLMDGKKFVQFLDRFGLFDKVELIERLYFNMKLEGSWCPGLLKKLLWVRQYSGENKRSNLLAGIPVSNE